MADSWLCVRTEGCVGREVKNAGKYAVRALLGLGRPAWSLAARTGSALALVVPRRIFGFQFVHSPTFSDALPCAGGMAPALMRRQRTRPTISVPGRVRNITGAAESVLSKRRGLTGQAII